MRKKIAIPLISAAVFLLAWNVFARQEKELPFAKEFPVSLANPETVPDTQEWEFSGFIQGKEEASLSSKLGGQVLDIYVSEGEMVQKGQLLARLDVREATAQERAAFENLRSFKDIASATEKYYDQLIDEAESNLKKARAALELAQENGGSDEALAKQNVRIASEAVRSAKRGRDLQLEASQGSIAAAQGSLGSAQAVSSNGTIVAPFAGIVTSLPFKKGVFAPPGAGILSLASGNLLEMETYAPSSLAGSLKLGQEAVLSQNARAQITALSPQTDPSSAKIWVKFSLTEKGSLRLGDFAKGNLTIPTDKTALSVPLEAVVRRYEDSFVFVENAGLAELRNIKIAHTSNSRAFVLEGISAQDKIVVRGQHNLSSGVKIRTYAQ